jgi:hypothetical protein
MGLRIGNFNIHDVKNVSLSLGSVGTTTNWLSLRCESHITGEDYSTFELSIFIESKDMLRYKRAVDAFNAVLKAHSPKNADDIPF